MRGGSHRIKSDNVSSLCQSLVITLNRADVLTHLLFFSGRAKMVALLGLVHIGLQLDAVGRSIVNKD